MLNLALFNLPSISLINRLDTTFDEAVVQADRASTAVGLPMTLFINDDTSGWWYTNVYASTLNRSLVQVTILPSNFFSN